MSKGSAYISRSDSERPTTALLPRETEANDVSRSQLHVVPRCILATCLSFLGRSYTALILMAHLLRGKQAGVQKDLSPGITPEFFAVDDVRQPVYVDCAC
jgi:hypothetical protein